MVEETRSANAGSGRDLAVAIPLRPSDSRVSSGSLSERAQLVQSKSEKDLSHDLRTEHDIHRKSRLRRLVKDSQVTWPTEDDAPKDPRQAMYQLLSHVKLDADGGILNLIHQGGQLSKIKALRKDGFEMILACLAAVRSVANPLGMIYFGYRVLYGIYFDDNYRQNLLDHCSKIAFDVPLEQIIVFCAVLEILVAACCVLIALYHGCLGICGSKRSHDGYKELQDTVTPSYVYLSTFYLRDLPTLQNLSIFRILAYAHPNLISKNAKQFSSRNCYARAILEKFVNKKQNDTCNDEQLVDEVSRLIVQFDHKDKTEEDQYEEANLMVDLSTYDALLELNRSRMLRENRAELERTHNVDALQQIWRLHCAVYFEYFVFGCLIVSSVFIGVLEFFTKICRCSFLLTNDDTSMMIALLYFLQLLNQCMGMNSLQELLRWRVETFIFGGSDAIVSAEEKYTMKVYLAILMDKIWNHEKLSFIQKMAIMLQFDDDDLQQLVVEECPHSKAIVAATVRKWMRESGTANHVTEGIQRWVSQ